MSSDTIRTAYEALGARDVEPLVALMHPELAWRGRRTWRFWRPAPSCHGPDEAREALSSTIEWRNHEGDHDLLVDRVEQRDGRFAVVFSWTERAGGRQEWAQLLRVRGGTIIDIEDYASGARALRALRRRRLRLRSRAG